MFALWGMRTLGLALQAARAVGGQGEKWSSKGGEGPVGDQPASRRQLGQIGEQE